MVLGGQTRKGKSSFRKDRGKAVSQLTFKTCRSNNKSEWHASNANSEKIKTCLKHTYVILQSLFVNICFNKGTLLGAGVIICFYMKLCEESSNIYSYKKQTLA